MTELESIVLEHLRHIRRVEVKSRVGALEREVAQVHVKIAEQSGRIDRLNERVERIERRLDLSEASA